MYTKDVYICSTHAHIYKCVCVYVHSAFTHMLTHEAYAQHLYVSIPSVCVSARCTRVCAAHVCHVLMYHALMYVILTHSTQVCPILMPRPPPGMATEENTQSHFDILRLLLTYLLIL